MVNLIASWPGDAFTVDKIVAPPVFSVIVLEEAVMVTAVTVAALVVLKSILSFVLFAPRV